MQRGELESIYYSPFFDLLDRARAIHREHWRADEIQLCTLLSIKTGGCSENCSYCAQSAHYHTGVSPQPLLSVAEIVHCATAAKANGSSRFCMGAAWKGIRASDRRFSQVLEIVRQVSQLGLEVCVTLGQIGPEEAKALKTAGVTAYNHNIDTSEEFYSNIVTTHTFADRLATIEAVQEADISVCSGGIIGMGETERDRLAMLETLTSLNPTPESVPINCLLPMPGTPLAQQDPVDIFELVRLIATTRISLPKARVRLSAGRTRLTREGQALCFLAGANSIFYGNKLLTAENPETSDDRELMKSLDLVLAESPV